MPELDLHMLLGWRPSKFEPAPRSTQFMLLVSWGDQSTLKGSSNASCIPRSVFLAASPQALWCPKACGAVPLVLPPFQACWLSLLQPGYKRTEPRPGQDSRLQHWHQLQPRQPLTARPSMVPQRRRLAGMVALLALGALAALAAWRSSPTVVAPARRLVLAAAIPAATSTVQPCAEAYATLLTSTDYLPGAEALAWGLQKHGRAPRAVLVLLPEAWREERPAAVAALQALCVSTVFVPPLANPYEAELPDWGARFATRNGTSPMMKLHAWALTTFRHILLVDSDQVVLRGYDSIFDDHEPLAAGPATFGDAHAFATGTLLLAPDAATHAGLLAALGTQYDDMYDRADMGFLNAFYKDWWAAERARNASSGSRHVLPWHAVAWRRVIALAPARWAEVQQDTLGVDCSGPLHEKPWGSAWREQKPYREVYEHWQALHAEARVAQAAAPADPAEAAARCNALRGCSVRSQGLLVDFA